MLFIKPKRLHGQTGRLYYMRMTIILFCTSFISKYDAEGAKCARWQTDLGDLRGTLLRREVASGTAVRDLATPQDPQSWPRGQSIRFLIIWSPNIAHTSLHYHKLTSAPRHTERVRRVSPEADNGCLWWHRSRVRALHHLDSTNPHILPHLSIYPST